jgi:hypothetical protein
MVAETVAHVSNRLVLLYTEKIAPLVPYMKGGDVDSPDPDFKAKAASYFIGSRECAALMSRYNTTGANADDIRYFIEYAGIAGVLWQMRRYLANEPEAFQAQLDQWMSAVMVREWHNIADNSPEEISLLEAQLIYNMQNALTPEALTGGGAELGTGVEISLLRAMDEDAIKEIIEETGRCSIWKAAARLRKWQFTRSSALRAGDASDMAMGPQMQMRVASLKPRAVVLVDTGEGDLGKVQSHAAACRLALSIGPAYMRSPTPCALSARLISARLASTPAMSTDEGDALIRHQMEAGTRDSDGMRHSAKVAWRALAQLQREIEAENAEKEQQLAASVPVRRLGESADVARAVSFFAHPDNGFVTGQVLYVCGGTSVGSLLL